MGRFAFTRFSLGLDATASRPKGMVVGKAIAGVVLLLLLAFAVLAVFEADYLWTAQEQNLFLSTPLFFEQCMQVSGGLLSWAGAWLTQFFYYPALGAGVLCLLWGLLMLLLRRAFRLPGAWAWLVLVPPAMLLLADVALGYWVYFLKLRGNLFVPTLGLMAVALLFWCYRVLPPRYGLRSLFIAVATVAAYPLFGFYGLLAVLLMAVAAFRQRHYAEVAVAVAGIVAVPLLCYHLLYSQTPLVNIWFTALPIFVHNGVADRWQYYPYVVIVLWLAAVAWRPRVRPLLVWEQAMVVLMVLINVWVGWPKDDNFSRQLTMYRQMEQLDWQGMLTTISKTKGEPTRALSMMKNLALQRTGRLAADLTRYPDGFARPDAPFPVHSVHTIGKMLYWQYGIPNYCYRWCMEDGVEYGWNVAELKLMAKCSLLNGEPVAAQRYLSLLKKTTFYRPWALKYETYIRQPRLMADDAEIQAIAPLLRDDDFLTSDQSQLEPFLIEHFASYPGTTPEQQEMMSVYFKFYLNRNRYVER